GLLRVRPRHRRHGRRRRDPRRAHRFAWLPPGRAARGRRDRARRAGLTAPVKALFISDLHLSDDTPATLAAFDALLAGPARGVDALYILGDLFEYWAGDDDDTPLARHVAAGLRVLADTGVRLHFLAGNRDF